MKEWICLPFIAIWITFFSSLFFNSPFFVLELKKINIKNMRQVLFFFCSMKFNSEKIVVSEHFNLMKFHLKTIWCVFQIVWWQRVDIKLDGMLKIVCTRKTFPFFRCHAVTGYFRIHIFHFPTPFSKNPSPPLEFNKKTMQYGKLFFIK
jgi:hypothetical protein